MTGLPRLRVLIAGHLISGEATGEGYVAFKLTEALSAQADVTLVTLQSPRHQDLRAQLPLARVVRFDQPQKFHRFRTARELLKPELSTYGRQLRQYLARHGAEFDIAHQLMPAALRHPSPLRGCGVPYVLGPFGGSLPTPKPFARETRNSAPWYARLRALDGALLRCHPALRQAHREAAMILGVAPYMWGILDGAASPMRAYADFMKLGIEELPDLPKPAPRRASDPLRLVHVGRGVRTKGLRDVIRAMGQMREDRRFYLDSAGAGPEIEICRALAQELGVADRVRFHGRLPRAEVEALYAQADVFAFPSFREPAGAVFFEAMRWGLPVVTARAGGAEAIIDDTCGLRLEVTDPETYARDCATALRQLADAPELSARLSAGARARVRDALWPNRAAQLLRLYTQALGARAPVQERSL